MQKYSYSLYWVCDEQRFEICENQYCKTFIPYFQVNGYFVKINKNKYSALVATNERKKKW